MTQTSTPAIWLFVAVAAAIGMMSFAVGQTFTGAGVPLVFILTVIWTLYARQRWGENHG